jgi:bile acid-coenzyme A ligase
MVVTGGVNVFPAEVEVVLSEHLGVADVVVIGVPDPDWGQRVHAIIEPTSGTNDTNLISKLDELCRSRMAAPKVPKSYEIVERLPRDESGKIRRSALVEAASRVHSNGAE